MTGFAIILEASQVTVVINLFSYQLLKYTMYRYRIAEFILVIEYIDTNETIYMSPS